MNTDIVQDICAALDQRQTSPCHVLSGPACSDKAMLVDDVVNRLDKAHCYIYHIRFYDQTCCNENPLRDLLLSLLHADEDTDISALLTSCNNIVASHSTKPELFTATCYHLLGHAIPKQLTSLYSALTHAKRQQIRAQLLCELVKQRQSEQSVVLVLEELQYAHNEQRKLLKELLQLPAQYPLFIVMTTTHISTALSTLLDTALVTLHTMSEKNKLQMPSLATLNDRDQQALSIAAVLGLRFSPDALTSILDDPHYDPQPLIEAGILTFQRLTLQFCHEHIQQTIYADLSATVRQQYHLAAAAYYRFGNSVMYACHLIRAGDAGAANACLTAALTLRDEDKLDQACLFFDKCMQLVDNDHDRFVAASLKADSLLDANEYTLAVQAYDAAQRLTQDEQQQAQTWLGMAIALLRRKHNHTARPLLQRAQKLLISLPDHVQLARFYYYLALSAELANEPVNAITTNKIALEHAKVVQHTYWEAQISLSLGRLGVMVINPNQAYTQLHHALDLSREKGYKLIELASLLELAKIHLYQLELRDALSDLNYAIHLANMLDDMEMMVQAQKLLSFYDLLRGQYAQMVKHTELAQQLSSLLQHNHQESYVQCLGEIAADYAQLPAPLYDKPKEQSPLLPATQALISGDRETALLYLSNGRSGLRKLAPLTALEYCFFAIEACIKHRLWDIGEDLADHLITRMQAEPLPLYLMCAERLRVLASLQNQPTNETLRVKLFDILTRCRHYGLQFYLPACDQALKRKQAAESCL